MKVYYPDATDNNSDWSKRTWDLPKDVPGFMQHLADNAEFYDDGIKGAYVAFLALPVAAAMPIRLKADIDTIIFGGENSAPSEA